MPVVAKATSVRIFLFLVEARHATAWFVDDLEGCIQNHAIKLAETFPQWGYSCLPPTSCVEIPPVPGQPHFHGR